MLREEEWGGGVAKRSGTEELRREVPQEWRGRYLSAREESGE